MGDVFAWVRNVSQCSYLVENVTWSDGSLGIVPSLGGWVVAVVTFVIGIGACLLAQLFNAIRRFVYRDKNNIDTDFDAGGKVSIGLTATTIVSQWTWAATLLQSSAVAAKYGISGPFWYAAGATIQVLLFAMISVQLKIKAPGAKTFLQVIRARFGKKTHITFCVFALMTNIIVTAMLMLGGAAVLTSLVSGLSVELATGMVAAVIGTYTFIGGLGATFYVSYFNTTIIFIIMAVFLTKVYHQADDPDNPLGSVEKVYDLITCSRGPDGNEAESFLTMISNPGLMFGVINIVGNFGTVFVDQSYWQSSVAAKPKQGVWGFLSGGVVWFAVPFTFATTMGLAYIALSAQNGQPLLTDAEVNEGLVAPVVAQKLMGQTGEILIVLLVLMAVTSTGSAEVIAVTSILVYDVYQLYLKPYRAVFDSNSCILCGRQRGRMANPRDKCTCVSMTYCVDCTSDDEQRSEWKRAIKPPYTCVTHGPYRTYNDYLVQLKNWCLLWSTLGIIPLTMILYAIEVSLGWVYLFMGVLIGSAVVPIVLCMTWTRLTGQGMMCGAIGGAIIGITVWLSVAATRPGGLGNFMANTGAEVSMLCGNVSAIASGGLITVIVTFITNRDFSEEAAREVWENTRDIDNPLSPWTELYARDLNLTGANQLDNRPPLDEVNKNFKTARYIAYIGALSLTAFFVVVWPSISTLAGVFSLSAFTHWLNVSQAWGYTAGIFIIIMPVVNEALEIGRALTDLKRVIPATNSSGPAKRTSAYTTNTNTRMSEKKTKGESSPGGTSQQHNHGNSVKTIPDDQDVENPREPVFS